MLKELWAEVKEDGGGWKIRAALDALLLLAVLAALTMNTVTMVKVLQMDAELKDGGCVRGTSGQSRKGTFRDV
jgi:hypothetical protein